MRACTVVMNVQIEYRYVHVRMYHFAHACTCVSTVCICSTHVGTYILVVYYTVCLWPCVFF